MPAFKKSVQVTDPELYQKAKELFEYNEDFNKRVSLLLARQAQERQDMVNEGETKGRDMFVRAMQPHIGNADPHLAFKKGTYFFNFQFYDEHGYIFVVQPHEQVVGLPGEVPAMGLDEDPDLGSNFH